MQIQDESILAPGPDRADANLLEVKDEKGRPAFVIAVKSVHAGRRRTLLLTAAEAMGLGQAVIAQAGVAIHLTRQREPPSLIGLDKFAAPLQ